MEATTTTETRMGLTVTCVVDPAADPPLTESITFLCPEDILLSAPCHLHAFARTLEREIQDREKAQEEHTNLQRELAGLRTRAFTPSTESGQSEIGDAGDLQIERPAVQLPPNELGDLKDRLEQLLAENKDLKATMKVKDNRIAKLEKERDMKEPLYQVGVDVRLGCLEQAKEALWNGYVANPGIMEKRNVAAHEGNWKADISLLFLDIISLGSRQRADMISYELWTKLYYILPSKYAHSLSFPRDVLEATNHSFTVSAAGLLYSPVGQERQIQALEIVKDVLDHWVSCVHEFPRLEKAVLEMDWPRTIIPDSGEEEDRADYYQDGEDYSWPGRVAKLEAIKNEIVLEVRRRRGG